MSQPTPPSQPTDGNPYAGQQPVSGNPYAAQQPADGNPFAGQQQATGGNPFAGDQQSGFVPPAPRRDNIALGIVAAVVAALVTAGVYGAIIGATEYEIGYAAVGVGFLIGLAAGRIGGRNPLLPVVSAVLALGAVYLGQLLGIAMYVADHSALTVTSVFTEHFSELSEGWKTDADAMTFLFFAIGAYAAFSGTKKAAA